jgi:hypothetical protein
MPSEKLGTIVSDFGAYGIREEKGVDMKLDGDGKTKRGAMLRVVVGKVFQIRPLLTTVQTRR